MMTKTKKNEISNKIRETHFLIKKTYPSIQITSLIKSKRKTNIRTSEKKGGLWIEHGFNLPFLRMNYDFFFAKCECNTLRSFFFLIYRNDSTKDWRLAIDYMCAENVCLSVVTLCLHSLVFFCFVQFHNFLFFYFVFMNEYKRKKKCFQI